MDNRSSLELSEVLTGINEDPSPACENLLLKLNSTGPLDITNLKEFLTKAKVDFQNLYKDTTIANLKMKDFKVIKDLGAGTFGKVVLAQLNGGDDLYAIKTINKKTVLESKKFYHIHSEKRILQSLNFPFVISLKFFFVDFDYLYFAMSYVPGGDFFEFLTDHKPLSEPHAKFYACQLVLALEYLHYLELIHRDVKPENIMIDATGYIKLADFGLCCRCPKNAKAWTFTGTPQYMAPEVLKRAGYDFSVDWWALGVVVYEMCAGFRPFESADTSEVLQLVRKSAYEMPTSCFSKKLNSFIKQLLTIPVTKRLGCKPNKRGAKQVKNHEWFQNVKWLAVLNRTHSNPFVPEPNRSSQGLSNR